MKAITYERYGGPEVIQIKEVPIPELQPNQVLIKVNSLAINPYDWHFMRGTPFFLRLQYGLFKPKQSILGSDIAGEIVQVGDEVTDVKIGDRVMAGAKLGGFAEFAAVDIDRVTRMPKGYSWNAAAALIMAGVTAHEAVHGFADVSSNDRVLINGASGGVGHLAVQIAHATGAHVTGVCSGKNAEWVKQLGADEVIDYTKVDLSQWDQQYDVILDVNGNLTLPIYKKLLLPDGKIAVVGYNGMPDMMKKMWYQQFGKLNLHVVGVDENRKSMNALVHLAEAGKIKPFISKTYPIDQFAQAIDHLEHGHAVGKVVVEIPVDGKA